MRKNSILTNYLQEHSRHIRNLALGFLGMLDIVEANAADRANLLGGQGREYALNHLTFARLGARLEHRGAGENVGRYLLTSP